MMTRSIVTTLAIVAVCFSLVTAQNTAATMMEAARKTAVVDGDLDGAIRQYEAIVETYAKTDRAAAATALVRMAGDYQKLGRAAESQRPTSASCASSANRAKRSPKRGRGWRVRSLPLFPSRSRPLAASGLARIRTSVRMSRHQTTITRVWSVPPAMSS
jgi:hypothetical protein